MLLPVLIKIIRIPLLCLLITTLTFAETTISSTETDVTNLISLGGTITHGFDKTLYDSQDASKAFDGMVYTKWSFQKTGDYPWIAWTFLSGGSEVANLYEVSSANDEPARDPKHWKIWGLRQGGSWVLLDERNSVTWSQRYQTQRFTMNNVVAYNTYKFEFMERCGDDIWWDMYQLSEWRLLYKPLPTPSPAAEPRYPVFDPFIFGDNCNYEVPETCLEEVVTDMEVLRSYLAARDLYSTVALQNTRVLALSGMTLEAASLFKLTLIGQTKSPNPIDLYFYSDHRLGHIVDDAVAASLISLAEFTRPSRIVFGDGSVRREGMAAVIQWMVDNRHRDYFKKLEYFQMSGHLAASYEGSAEEGAALQTTIVSNLRLMCTDKSHFPKLKLLNFNKNAYNEFNNGFDAALRDACDKETGVTIRAYEVDVWYPPMCDDTNPDNYAYYDRDDEKEMAQCRFTWNWEVSGGDRVYASNGPFPNENTVPCVEQSVQIGGVMTE